MAYRESSGLEVPSDMKLSRLSTPSQISSYIKKLIKATQYDYRESEALEVSEVLLNDPENRDSIRGTFIVSGEDPGIVKSLIPHITAVPVVGEHIVCVEYNGQHYYTSIINRKSSINENAISGVSTNFGDNVKFGKDFERKKVKPLRIGEGCILYEGRFGQSIHLDGHQNKPTIKISTHVDDKPGGFRGEDIDNDDASIYLVSNGVSGSFDGQDVKGKKVLIKSDGIFISGRTTKDSKGVVKLRADDNISLDGTESINLKSKAINLGEGQSQPVVLGNDLTGILKDLVSILKLYPTLINNAQVPVGTTDPTMITKIGGLTLKINTMLSKTVKTV